MVLVNPGDAPFLTPLTSGQAEHFAAMEAELTEEERELHGEFFQQCRDKFTNPFPAPPLQIIKVGSQWFDPIYCNTQDPGYYAMMEEVLGSARPRQFYSASPATTGVLFYLVRLLPRSLQDLARTAIMRLPGKKN